MSPLPLKIAFAAAWLIVAWIFSRWAPLRTIACCGASAILLMHGFAAAGMWVQRNVFRGPAMEGAVIPYIGFFAGIVLGLMLGIAAGILWSRFPWFYWLAHLGAVAFLLLLPLYEW